MNDGEKRRRTARVLASSGLVMLITGLALFAWHDVAPGQRVAPLLGLEHEFWAHVHIAASIIFSAAVLFHARLNLVGLRRHFVRRHAKEHGSRSEGV